MTPRFLSINFVTFWSAAINLPAIPLCAQTQQNDTWPQLMALEHTNREIFSAAPHVKPATRRYLDKIEALRTNISHEMMHRIMNQLRNRSRTLQEALNKTESVNERIAGDRYGYSGWFSYFAEETICSVSSRIEKSPQGKFQDPEFITAMLPSFESSDETFERFLTRLLYDLQRQTETGDKKP